MPQKITKALSALEAKQSPYLADDIGGLARDEELAQLVECLNKASTAHGMKISAEKTKLMTNNTSSITKEVKANGQKLETVTNLKQLGSVISDAAMKRLKQFGTQEHFSQFQNTTDALPFHVQLPVCL